MMKNKMFKLSCLLMLFSTAVVHAQQFNYKADLDPVKETGFYTIKLSPEITSHLKTDFSDFRIADEKGKWVPHIILNGTEVIKKEKVIDFPILSNSITDSGKTELILLNKADTLVSEIRLFLKNTAVSRTGIISGSNDQKHWFIISPVFIERSYETTVAEYIQELKFIPSDYRFFKVVINNFQNDPLNILHAGVYSNEYVEPPRLFIEHNNTMFVQKDSVTQTLLMITEKASGHIGKLRMNINGPKFYNRHLVIYLPDANGKPGKFIAEFELLRGIQEFEFPVVKTKQLLLVIDNKDNPPLSVTSISTAEPFVYATSYLDADHSYHLLMESDSASAPDFDLVQFKDSIPSNTLFLAAGKITAVEKAQPAPAEKSFFKKWFIWPILLLVLALLFMLVKSLLNDIHKSNTNN